jgi:Arc/MetJ-type ribon-helix-helix transcriptional regulator
MADVMIGARVRPMDISRAARNSGFLGSESRASVVRYAMLRAIGYEDREARELAARKRINADAGMIVGGDNITAKIDSDLLAEIESKMPEGIADRATFIRYSLFRAADYTHDEALDEAKREPGRPRKNASLASQVVAELKGTLKGYRK